MPAPKKAKPASTRAKTKVKTRGRIVPIIDQMDAGGNPLPMSRYVSTETKASRTGPFKGRIR